MECIYEITCLDENIKEHYIGHTKNFKERIQRHKCISENSKKYNIKLYKFIRENGGWANWIICPIYIDNNLTKDELKEIEGICIELEGPQLNTQRGLWTLKQFYKESWENSGKLWSDKKVVCNECDTEMNQSSLTRHKKRLH
jgi:hypothetical protein